MYNEEDRREDQQTSGEQAPRYEHYQFHEETGIVPDRVPPVRNKKQILLEKKQGRQWLWQCFSGW